MQKSILLFLSTLIIINYLPAQQPAWRQASCTEGVRISDIDIYYTNPDTLYALGFPSFLLSTDNGENWNNISSGLYHGVISIDPFDSKRIYLNHDILPFYGNEVMKSIDGGLNWVSLFWGIGHPPTVDAPIVEIDPVDLTTVYVSKNYHNLFRSDDYGNTWDSIPLPNGNALSSLAISSSNNNILYAGFAAPTQIFKSTDRGKTWEQLYFPLNELSGLLICIHPQNADIVYATVFSYGSLPGGVYKTKDGGFNWEEKNNGLTNQDLDIYEIAMNPKNPYEMFIGTGSDNHHLLFKTTDGGDNWFLFNDGLPDSAHVSSIALDTLNGRFYTGIISSGDSSGIFFCDVSTTVGNKTIESPKTFALLQNYPNPFNLYTMIEYVLPTSGNVSLEIFDITGRRVKSLAKNFHEAGLYRKVWNCKNCDDKQVSSGVYLFVLQADDFKKVKSAMLIK